ncbi:MAG: AMP-binding protein [Melioribacteraceae bacterium]
MILFHSNNDMAIISNDNNSSYLDILYKAKSISDNLLSGIINERIITSNNSPYDFIISLLSIWFSKNTPVVMNPIFTTSQRKELIDELDFRYAFDEIIDGYILKQSEINNPSDYDLNITSTKDTALILFTSGSTSKPKSVELIFSNLINNFHCINSLVPIKSNEKFGLTLPFYHIGGFQIIFRAFFSGNAIVIPDSLKSNDIFTSTQLHSVNYISIVSKTLFDLIESEYQFHQRLKAIFLGGGFSNNPFVIKAIERGMKIYKVYGSTETTSMITGFECNKFLDKIDSSGKPLFDVQIQIDKDGHILLKSGSVMKGYINYPNAYKETGWFNSFDFGHLDSDGFLFIDSRREDMIVSGGENINLNEINNLISNHPSIISAFSFGKEDEKWGQILYSAVLLKKGISLTEEELKNFLKKQTVSYKIPKRIFFLDKFPLTELGKIKREELLKTIDSYLQ